MAGEREKVTIVCRMNRIRTTVLLLCFALLAGCVPRPQAQQYAATFLDYFDTATVIMGRANSREAFDELVQPLRDELERYHKLFDIYHEYEGMNNLKTVNDNAAAAPVRVDGDILELLQDCKEYYRVTGGVFNPAMGSVLRLWHDAREDGRNDPENARLPDDAALRDAAQHMDPDDIVLDREKGTVFFADPALRLDVGGIAKGWAVQRLCGSAPAGLLVSVGGNVCATGPKDESGTPWAVGLQNPDGGDDYLETLEITDGCVVTSGSYQRVYTVDGRQYNHIIDPETLYPGERWTSVTIVCDDSGTADVLSTALFLLDREAGEALLQRYGAEALWVDAAGERCYSVGFRDFIREE